MLVRPFSDIHAEFWQPNKIPSILEKVVRLQGCGGESSVR